MNTSTIQLVKSLSVGTISAGTLSESQAQSAREIAAVSDAESRPYESSVPFGHGRLPSGPPEHPEYKYYYTGNRNRISFRTFSDKYWPHENGDQWEDRWRNWMWVVKQESRRTDFWDDQWYVGPPQPVGSAIIMIVYNFDLDEASPVSIYSKSDCWQAAYIGKSGQKYHHTINQGHENRVKIHGEHWGPIGNGIFGTRTTKRLTRQLT